MIAPKVALSKGFMEAYSRLPRSQQKKVRDFTEKFQRDPTQPGINFERLQGVRDDKVRSVRIDNAYRAIVVHPPQGDVYLCVWVDHHDAAYRWAENRVFEVNPKSGSFQIFDTKEVGVAAPAAETEQVGLFEDVDEEDLLLAGVPSLLLPSVRALKNEGELDKLAPLLPAEAAEMLFYFAAGYSLLEAIEECHRSKPEPADVVDTQDFAQALEKPESRISFKIVEDEQELEKMLEAPLEQWRVFLHPSQSRLVQMHAKGPVRVLGGAGTGKTVVLMHRARHLASSIFRDPDDRILVTTFTRNLAFDLAANLRNLCNDEFERIEVTNLHSWAVGMMRRHGHSFNIVTAPLRDELLQRAANELGSDEYPSTFYRDEWDHVVQAQDVRTRDDYFTARRVGRGIRLIRRQRADVWKVLDRYRRLLEERRLMEWPDVIRETRLFMEKQGIRSPYRAVLVDEVQDLTPNDLRLIRLIAPGGENTLFLVGDGHQRIYGKPVALSSFGIAIQGRSRRLRMNYRTTAQIRRQGVVLLEGLEIDDLDGGTDDLKGYHSLRQGPVPKILHSRSEADEAASVVSTVKRWLDQVPARDICIAARHTSQLTERYKQILEGAGIETVRVETDPEVESTEPGVRLATMHRLKGLEFPRVLLAGVKKGTVPVPYSGHPEDDIGRTEHEIQERCLLYVAATRARDELVITGYGERSPFLG